MARFWSSPWGLVLGRTMLTGMLAPILLPFAHACPLCCSLLVMNPAHATTHSLGASPLSYCRACGADGQAKGMLAAAILLAVLLVGLMFARDWDFGSGPGILTKIKIMLTHFQVPRGICQQNIPGMCLQHILLPGRAWVWDRPAEPKNAHTSHPLGASMPTHLLITKCTCMTPPTTHHPYHKYTHTPETPALR